MACLAREPIELRGRMRLPHDEEDCGARRPHDHFHRPAHVARAVRPEPQLISSFHAASNDLRRATSDFMDFGGCGYHGLPVLCRTPLPHAFFYFFYLTSLAGLL